MSCMYEFLLWGNKELFKRSKTAPVPAKVATVTTAWGPHFEIRALYRGLLTNYGIA